MIALKRHLDQAVQTGYLQYCESLTKRMTQTCWIVLLRYIYFARRMGCFDGESAMAAAARTSRKAYREKRQDAGTQGYLKKLISQGMKLCHDIKSIRRVEDHLEAMGIIEFERNGKGKVAIAHIHLRKAILFLEQFHPDLEWLESVVGKDFNWLFHFGSEVLGRPFNRRDAEIGNEYEYQYLEQDLGEFEAVYPAKKLNPSVIPDLVQGAFRRFCRGAKRMIGEMMSVVVYWDVDISDPPDWDLVTV